MAPGERFRDEVLLVLAGLTESTSRILGQCGDGKGWVPLTVALLAAIGVTVQCAGAEAAETVEAAKKPSDIAPARIQEIRAPFKMPRLQRPQFAARTFDIRKYGARGDGKTNSTRAFAKAIAACSASGGGKVLVPAGKWFTGAIHLKSHVNLHLGQGAEIHFSTEPKDYLPVVFTRWAGFELYNYSPLIYARHCENIAVTGPGKLFGHGKPWWRWAAIQQKTCLRVYHEQVLKDVPPEKRVYGTPKAGLRPQFISPINCKNVLLEGFTIAEAGPFWTIQLVYCENVIVRGLRVNTVGGPNTDGINLDSCKNALVEYCQINAGDDCVALKSGINEDGRRVGRPTENVVIRHIKGGHCHGGIVIGSETSGGIRNIFARDCHFQGADRGIRLKSNASRGGVVERLWYRDIRLEGIKAEAIVINTNYGAWMASKSGKTYPLFRDIRFKNITCGGAKVAASLRGTSHKPLENITFEDVSVKARAGMRFAWVKGLKLHNVRVKPSRGKPMIFEHCTDVTTSPP